MKTCNKQGCDDPYYARGFCHRHYNALWREENRLYYREYHREYARRTADERNDRVRKRRSDDSASFTRYQRLYRLKQSVSRICQVTGSSNVPRLPGGALTATLVDQCHIKPKRYCSRDERLDKSNILHLDVRLHRLFDALRIMVAPNGSIMVDKDVSDAVADEWEGRKVNGYTHENDAYMAFHRRLCYYGGFEERNHA